MKFAEWIDTYINEKGIDTEYNLHVEGPSGLNVMPVGIVIDAMKQAPTSEQRQIKRTLVAIDFANGDALHYVRHLAQAIAQ